MSNEKKGNQNKEKSGESKPEIRYVPVDLRAIEDDDEVNIVETFQAFWKERRIVLKSTVFFAVLGVLIALLSIEEYTSEVRVLPESQENFSLGALGGLAQQFGFSSIPETSSESLPANLYPAIIQSNVFIEDLMNYDVTLPSSGEEVTLKTYFEDHIEWSVFGYVIRFPIMLKKWITGMGGRENSQIDEMIADKGKLNRLVRMSREDWETLREIRDRISASLDSETGVVTVRAKMQDPLIAADIADEVVNMLSEYITEKRTEKSRRELEFIQERFEEARSRFEQAQRELAEFNDENRGQLTAVARTEEQLLQSQYDLNFNLYNSMAGRLEEARIQLQEETPVVNVLEPAAVPDKRSEPQRILIVLIFLLTGFIIGLAIIYGKSYWRKVQAGLDKK